MPICVPSMNDFNVTRAKHDWRNGATHDDDRESMYLHFVACVGRVWLHCCCTCASWKSFGERGHEVVGTERESFEGAWLPRPRSLRAALGVEKHPGFVCERFMFRIWHFGR